MERHPMTPEGHARLKAELTRLKSDERHRVIREIAQAREHGDIAENAEYHAAKERQGMIEARIKELENKVGLAEIIDITKVSGDHIQFGAIVTVLDEESEEESTYQIVGADEAEVNEGRLSISSPLGRALIGKSVGDGVEINTPRGVRVYEILKFKFSKKRLR